MRRKYIGTGLSPVKGDYLILNKDNDEVIEADCTQDDANTIAQAYNHQYCEPNFPAKYIVKHKNEHHEKESVDND